MGLCILGLEVKSILYGGLRSKKLKRGMISTTDSHIVRKKLYTHV